MSRDRDEAIASELADALMRTPTGDLTDWWEAADRRVADREAGRVKRGKRDGMTERH